MSETAQWDAAWIWSSNHESPRNEWRCFRRAFSLNDSPVGEATIRLTADSRYVLFVNGIQVGRGPVRSWPFELAYDEYDVGQWLKPGTDNVIAVLVMHYGISTFQYLRGRGGLLLQLHTLSEQNEAIITDDSWKTTVHSGYDVNSSRISCQLGFTEIIDARSFDSSWIMPGFDDNHWEAATIIGPVGMEPWTTLVERDIPYLTEEIIHPSRVESLNYVKPASWGAVIDVRSLMAPDSANHANPVQFVGYIATIVTMTCNTSFTIGIVDDGRISYAISIDGRWYKPDEFHGEHPERYLTIELTTGNHILLIDVTGSSHGHGFHIGFDCKEQFELSAPLFSDSSSTPFVTIGPFDTIEIIDHQIQRSIARDHPDYVALHKIATTSELNEWLHWIKPVPLSMINLTDVFAANVWKTTELAHPVPNSLQNAVIASNNEAIVPIHHQLDSEIIIDFGRELSGYISFELDAASGTIIDFYGFEYMSDGWRQHTQLVDNTMRYTCHEGRQSYVSFIRRGLRYLAITIRQPARPVGIYRMTMLQSNYPVSEIGKFQCSDPLLNDIWTISRDTTRLCMEDTFVDCPAFEQAFWVGDARNEALVNYYTFGSREIVERCLKLVPGSAFQTPLYSDQVPSGWNSVIPNWTFFWITACLEYYRYDGSKKFLSDMWPHIKHTLEQYAAKLNDQGLFSNNGWNLLDWAPFEQPREGIVTPQNMFLVKAFLEAAEIAATVGDSQSRDMLVERSGKLREAIELLLWDEEQGAYVDCIHADGRPSETFSMQTQVVAYLCDIPHKERIDIIEQYLVSPPASFVQIGSPFMLFFFYEALAKLGRLDILVEDIRRNYGLMIDHDATTCWEMFPWSGYNKNPKVLTRSHCHAWSAGPAYFLGAHTLGVQGLTPGWNKVRVSPQPMGFTWARGSVPLPQDGRIDISWHIEAKNRMHLRITAPHHIELLTQAPEGYELTVEYIRIGLT